MEKIGSAQLRGFVRFEAIAVPCVCQQMEVRSSWHILLLSEPLSREAPTVRRISALTSDKCPDQNGQENKLAMLRQVGCRRNCGVFSFLPAKPPEQ